MVVPGDSHGQHMQVVNVEKRVRFRVLCRSQEEQERQRYRQHGDAKRSEPAYDAAALRVAGMAPFAREA